MNKFETGDGVSSFVRNVDEILYFGQNLSDEIQREIGRKIYQLLGKKEDLEVLILSLFDEIEPLLDSVLSHNVLLDFIYGYLIGKWDIYGVPLGN